ncbi:hypothetical protein D3C73_1354400 [compost metagenome]
MVGVINAGDLLEQLGDIFFRPLDMLGDTVQRKLGIGIHFRGILIHLPDNQDMRVFLFAYDKAAHLLHDDMQLFPDALQRIGKVDIDDPAFGILEQRRFQERLLIQQL